MKTQVSILIGTVTLLCALWLSNDSSPAGIPRHINTKARPRPRPRPRHINTKAMSLRLYEICRLRKQRAVKGIRSTFEGGNAVKTVFVFLASMSFFKRKEFTHSEAQRGLVHRKAKGSHEGYLPL